MRHDSSCPWALVPAGEGRRGRRALTGRPHKSINHRYRAPNGGFANTTELICEAGLASRVHATWHAHRYTVPPCQRMALIRWNSKMCLPPHQRLSLKCLCWCLFLKQSDGKKMKWCCTHRCRKARRGLAHFLCLHRICGEDTKTTLRHLRGEKNKQALRGTQSDVFLITGLQIQIWEHWCGRNRGILKFSIIKNYISIIVC